MHNYDNDLTGRVFQRKKIEADVIVIGAGPAGICAAIASARMADLRSCEIIARWGRRAYNDPQK